MRKKSGIRKNSVWTKPRLARKIHDSVFSAIMADPENLLETYLGLHPEDRGQISLDDITNVSIRHVMYNGPYNDLSFKVGKKFIVLVEAQSTWSDNIILRLLLYALQQINIYIEQEQINLYRARAVDMPVIELYVVFTGERKAEIPEYIYLSQTVFASKTCDIEARARIIHVASDATQLQQYIGFCKVFREQVKEHGRTQKAIDETIRICKERNYLVNFLTNHENEVAKTMLTVLTQEYADQCRYNEAHADGKQEGKREGKQEGKREGKREGKLELSYEAARKMLRDGVMTATQIITYLPVLTHEDIARLQGELKMQ